MTDQATAELLSRLLDGDLEDAERRALEARLAAEPELRAQLDGLRRVQGATRTLAESMQPPAQLDDRIEPLSSGASPARSSVSPAVRWIGIAAGLALAVTVALEVARRSPGTDLPPAEPTRGLGSEATSPRTPPPTLRAADELRLADEISEPDLESPAASPAAPESAPAAEEKRRADDPERTAEPPSKPEADAAEPVRQRAKRAPEDARVTAEPLDEAKEQAREKSVLGSAKGADARPPSVGSMKRSLAPGAAAASAAAEEKAEHNAASVRLQLRDRAGSPVGTIPFSGSWAELGSQVEVTVAGGIIVAVDGQDEDRTDMASGARPEHRLLGVAVEVPDGRYLVVEADGSAP